MTSTICLFKCVPILELASHARRPKSQARLSPGACIWVATDLKLPTKLTARLSTHIFHHLTHAGAPSVKSSDRRTSQEWQVEARPGLQSLLLQLRHRIWPWHNSRQGGKGAPGTVHLQQGGSQSDRGCAITISCIQCLESSMHCTQLQHAL